MESVSTVTSKAERPSKKVALDGALGAELYQSG